MRSEEEEEDAYARKQISGSIALLMVRETKHHHSEGLPSHSLDLSSVTMVARGEGHVLLASGEKCPLKMNEEMMLARFRYSNVSFALCYSCCCSCSRARDGERYLFDKSTGRRKVLTTIKEPADLTVMYALGVTTTDFIE